jgi:hypothetical protein
MLLVAVVAGVVVPHVVTLRAVAVAVERPFHYLAD